MAPLARVLLCSLLLVVLAVACGSEPQTTTVSVLISDAPVGDLAAVVITIDQITFNRAGDDVVVDSFPNEDPDLPDTDTITVDLLQVQGLDHILVIDGVELPVGDYQNMRLSIIDEDIDASYVEEEGGDRRPLKVPSGELKLGRFEVLDEGVQTFVLEFNLPKAMTYNPDPDPDRYILKPRGVRIVDVGRAALLAGSVDDALFDAEPPCDEKLDPSLGNVVYLYLGHGLNAAALGDMFDPEDATAAAATLIEPYAAEPVGADGAYLFAYLPAGEYTVAFSCDAIDDDSETADGIAIPAPADQVVEVTLAEGEDASCSFPLDQGQCG